MIASKEEDWVSRPVWPAMFLSRLSWHLRCLNWLLSLHYLNQCLLMLEQDGALKVVPW